MKSEDSIGLGPLVAPLAGAYGAAIRLRRWAYDRGFLPSTEPPVFTVSVGGLEAGGTGKTPVAGLILEAFIKAGRAPGLLSRGYGRSTRGLILRRPGEPADPLRIGDEPAMLVHSGLDVPVAASEKRIRGARALAQMGCKALVLDDAFAHRALARHVDIVVLRGERPLGRGHLLPWGSLREPASSLARAHVLWLHYRDPPRGLPREITPFVDRATIVVSRARPKAARRLDGGAVAIAGQPVIAAAGIARPRRFATSVEELGGDLRHLVAYSDHHHFTGDDVASLGRRARDAGARAIVVTPKDAVKLGSLVDTSLAAIPYWVVGTRVEIESGAETLAEHLGLQVEDLGSPGAP